MSYNHKDKHWQCDHRVWVDGAGLMGDALTCENCGYSKYPEAFSWWSRLKFYLGYYKIRQLKQRELFHRDGVYPPRGDN
jgi:hypothetical protein